MSRLTFPKRVAWHVGANGRPPLTNHQQTNKINMHQINEIFFNYVFFPTAAIAYVVGMWSFIVWTIKTWLKERREKLDAKNKSGGTDK